MEESVPDEGFATVRCHVMKGTVHIRDPEAYSPLHSRALRAIALHQDLKDLLGAFGVGRRVMQDVLVDLFYSGLIYLDVHGGRVMPSPDVVEAINRGSLEHTISREKPLEVEVMWVQEMLSGQVMAHQLVSRYIERPATGSKTRPLVVPPDRLTAIESLASRTLARAALPILKEKSPPEETVLDRVERITDRKLVGGGTFFIPLRTLKPNPESGAITLPDVVGMPQSVVDAWTAALNPQGSAVEIAATSGLGTVSEACFPWVLAERWTETVGELARISKEVPTEQNTLELRDRLQRLRGISSRASELAGSTSRRRSVCGSAADHLAALQEISQTAEQYIVLGSAFANRRGVQVVLDSLRAALGRGVKVLLLVGIPDRLEDLRTLLPPGLAETASSSRTESLDEMPSLSIVASTAPFHSKFVLVDGRVTLVSSVNWLTTDVNGSTWEAGLTCEGVSLARDLASHIVPLLPRDSAFRRLLEGGEGLPPDNTSRYPWTAPVASLLDDYSTEIDSSSPSRRAQFTFQTDLETQIRDLRGASLVVDSDHRRLLTSAIGSATSEVVVTSDGLTEDGFGRVLTGLCEAAVKRGVKLVVRWGRGVPGRDGGAELLKAEARARELKQVLGDKIDINSSPAGVHGKVLLMDGKFGLVSSFNFLSFGGVPGRDRSLSGELGVATSDPDIVRELRESIDDQLGHGTASRTL